MYAATASSSTSRKAPDHWNTARSPRAQRRPLASPLGNFERTYAERREAVVRAFLTGVYTMREIADHFGVRYSTVSRAVHWFEAPSKRTHDA
ncbi:MAG TPA: helix-turn-helix domain-containing protein [Gammaproteobacteria bacterium]|nr:helix-turn-helix domain-containing protein [Gammaproteobacteria bacterium]